ncbi:Acyl-CoA dehydrogenase [Alteribacillus persepolensis]|uniref:Acyl-CoA dehydrogenase n=1 Tax=Alteribacillus persepolensis TaxID=568899 RepID=A0A1G8AVH8_9BACI|nr:acyl-CoA dehydrogenase family protein [Alteribacillus persepolensis]SDH24813.1 Acyl-CoA dehydrogenase [Alteribacillus persepolensis]
MSKVEDVQIAGGSFITEDIHYNQVFTAEDFSEEHQMIAKTTEDFVEKEILSLGEEGEKLNYDLTLQVIKKAGDVGILGASLPEEYGGLGLEGIRFALMKEKLNTQSAALTMPIGGHIGIGMLPITFFGTKHQREKYLTRLQTGDITTAFALTEPQSGTDASSIKTNAYLSEDGKYYILNGSKVFITNAGFADIFIVFAKLDGKDFSTFIVERQWDGVSIGPEEDKMGLKASSTCSMTFEDVKVPVENLLGEPGKGHIFAFNVLNFGRLSVGAGCLGNTKNTIYHSAAYANERVQFGKKISSFPLIAKKLAEMNMKAYVLESMVYRTAHLFDKGLKELDFNDSNVGEKSRKAVGEYMMECSINKVFGSETLDFAVDEGLQIHGGYGYMKEYPIEGLYRDSRIKRIFEGTSEMNRMFITNTVIRKLKKGKFRALEDALARVQETFTADNQTPSHDGALSRENELLSKTKELFTYLLSYALDVFEETLEDEQEVTSNFGDIIILMFAIESAVKRTEKIIAERGEEAAQYVMKMTTVYVQEAFEDVIDFAKEIAAAMFDGDELHQQLQKITENTFFIPINTILFKREIAQKVIDSESYSM